MREAGRAGIDRIMACRTSVERSCQMALRSTINFQRFFSTISLANEFAATQASMGAEICYPEARQAFLRARSRRL